MSKSLLVLCLKGLVRLKDLCLKASVVLCLQASVVLCLEASCALGSADKVRLRQRSPSQQSLAENFKTNCYVNNFPLWVD